MKAALNSGKSSSIGTVRASLTARWVREKSLIALAVAHTVQCAYGIEAYSKTAQRGSDLEQMTEATTSRLQYVAARLWFMACRC